MQRNYFVSIEHYNNEVPLELSEVINELAFNEQGLIPVITQDFHSKSVLMMAWMNKEAILNTIKTKRMTYWSRSRQELWVKGETSGHAQALIAISFDCDGDTILCQVEQKGAACHTDRESCFYLDVDIEKEHVIIK